jgi:REP element-mobilizing transposase RayT
MAHFEGHYYHLFNRGVNRQPIFKSSENYRFLLKRITQFLLSFPITLIAYCLMPNHYHFLFYVKNDAGLGPFLQRLFNSCTQAFNRQQNRTGTLFEGRAKSRLVDEINYLFHIVRYIHLNPVSAGLVEKPEDWIFSNYREFIGLRHGPIFDAEFLETQFGTPQDYKAFVEAENPPELEKRLQKYFLD